MERIHVDAPKRRVIRALQELGFRLVREREHISMLRTNTDGSTTPLTLPNHQRIKGATLRAMCTQSGVERSDFLEAYERS